MSTEILLNGRFVPLEEATVSVEDRGFQFGESVYEVIRVYRGRPFEMARHLRRLRVSLEMVGIDLGSGLDLLTEQSLELLRRSGLQEAAIYLQISPGAAHRSHLIPSDLTPTVVAMVNPVSPAAERVRQEGIRVITVPDDRWSRCYVKTTMLLPNTGARRRADQEGYDDALFLRDGFLMESTAGNAFLVFGDTVHTPPKSNYILHGITRELVLEQAAANNITCIEGPIPASRIRDADELFLTGTVSELVPVTTVDGRPVGTGRPGPMYARLLDIYRRHALGE